MLCFVVLAIIISFILIVKNYFNKKIVYDKKAVNFSKESALFINNPGEKTCDTSRIIMNI